MIHRQLKEKSKRAHLWLTSTRGCLILFNGWESLELRHLSHCPCSQTQTRQSPRSLSYWRRTAADLYVSWHFMTTVSLGWSSTWVCFREHKQEVAANTERVSLAWHLYILYRQSRQQAVAILENFCSSGQRLLQRLNVSRRNACMSATVTHKWRQWNDSNQ